MVSLRDPPITAAINISPDFTSVHSDGPSDVTTIPDAGPSYVRSVMFLPAASFNTSVKVSNGDTMFSRDTFGMDLAPTTVAPPGGTLSLSGALAIMTIPVSVVARNVL